MPFRRPYRPLLRWMLLFLRRDILRMRRCGDVGMLKFGMKKEGHILCLSSGQPQVILSTLSEYELLKRY